MQIRQRRMPASIDSLETRLLFSTAAKTYYISATGNDNNPGTSPSTAWRSIARANQTSYHAGDALLLQGQATFTGNLILTATDTGTAAAPIRISSYGTGRATLFAGDGDGITIRDTAGISISNLNITGAGPTINTGSGIDLFDDQVGKPRLSGVAIDSVSVSGFGFVGIGIGSATLTSGFSNVRITNSSVFNDDDAGIFSYAGAYTANPAPYGLAHSEIYVGHVIAYDNAGHAGKNDSGNGIELGNVDGATIERCVAYDNGADNSNPGSGPVGIWTYNSNAVIIQYNESYANTSTYIDGDGFDLDGGTTNSIVQYNYSHDNAGVGYLACEFPKATAYTGNTFRYNISQNDGRTHASPAFSVWSASNAPLITSTSIYDNTIFMSKPASGSPCGIDVYQATTNLHIFNNIIDVTGGLKTLVVQAAGTGLVIAGNDYWTGSAASIGISFGSASYKTLAAFRAGTGLEDFGGKATGLAANPMLEDAGGGMTVASADQLATVTAYELTASSPLIGAGINPAALEIQPGSFDYYGNPLPANSLLDIGANQPL